VTEGQRPIPDNASAQALIHFYRGELARSDAWRTRLDTTTNWAVGTTAALLSVAFGADVHVVVFPFALGLLLLFLSIEARRYRYYEVSIARVRAMEQAFLAPVLRRGPTDEPTLDSLANELDKPQIRVSQLDAVAVRLWRAYAWLFVIVYLAWFARLWTTPYDLESFDQAFNRLRAGPVPGSLFFGAGIGLAIWLGIQTVRGWRLARREGGRIRGTPLAPPH